MRRGARFLINTAANDEREITTAVGPPAPSGTTLTRVRGKLVVSVTNLLSRLIGQSLQGVTWQRGGRSRAGYG